MIMNQICCDIAYNHSITVLRALVVQDVDNTICCRMLPHLISLILSCGWGYPAFEQLGPGGQIVLIQHLNYQDLVVIMCLLKEFSTLIDKNFLGPMEYSFNCNVASKSQLCLCCSKKQLQSQIQVHFDLMYLTMILFNFLCLLALINYQGQEKKDIEN